jgi:hypothetical protein
MAMLLGGSQQIQLRNGWLKSGVVFQGQAEILDCSGGIT